MGQRENVFLISSSGIARSLKLPCTSEVGTVVTVNSSASLLEAPLQCKSISEKSSSQAGWMVHTQDFTSRD